MKASRAAARTMKAIEAVAQRVDRMESVVFLIADALDIDIEAQAEGPDDGFSLRDHLAENTVVELRESLDDLGLPTDGKKADLIERLAEYLEADG